MKVFLAGTQSYKPLRAKTLYCLDSFIDFYNNKGERLPSDQDRFEDYLLDSGAFTFMNSGHSISTLEEWYAYADRYADYVKKNKIRNYIELDIDKFIPYSEVLKLRDYIERKVGWKCVPVWHPSRGKDEFVRMVKEYNYAAFGGIVTASIKQRRFTEKYFNYFIDEAHRNHCRLHGLGFTATAKLPYIHFDTVDSTSWLSVARYNSMVKFDGSKVVGVKPSSKNTLCILNTNQKYEIGATAWLAFQKYAKYYL